MAEIRTKANAVLSDGPAGSPDQPPKLGLRDLFGVVEDAVVAAQQGITAKVLWTELAAIPGTRNGQPGRVTGPDAGTHTDPVTGVAGVHNVGEYAWYPSGWRRTGDVVDTTLIGEAIDTAEAAAATAAASAEVVAGMSERVGIPRVGGDEATPLTGFADALGRTVGWVRDDGGLELPGYEGAIQDRYSTDSGPDIRISYDALGRTMERMGPDGSLYLTGLGRSIQSYLAELTPPSGAGGLRGPSTKFGAGLSDVLLARGHAGHYCPPPLHSYPQVWSPPAGLQNLITVTRGSYIPVTTPYRVDDGVVHPSLMEFFDGFRGYRYILGLNGYYLTREIFENPLIYGSNDLAAFALLDGFEQPLSRAPDVASGHLSDITLSHDPRSGELICVYRQSIRLDGPASTAARTEDSLWYRSSRDGYAWSPSQKMIEFLRSVDGLYSPSLLYEPTTALWHLISTDGFVLKHRTASVLTGPWSAADTITPTSPLTTWHADVRYVGDRLVVLANDRTRDGLWLGVAAPGSWTSWTWGATPVLAPGTGAYKGTFGAHLSLDQTKLRVSIIWTSDQTNTPPWRLFVSAVDINM